MTTTTTESPKKSTSSKTTKRKAPRGNGAPAKSAAIQKPSGKEVDKAKVFILYTGGTIGMAPKEPSKLGSPLEPKPLAELLKFVPGLDESQVEFGYGSFDEPLDSSDVGPQHWIQMAKAIEDVYDDYDGFVILHGTDTMAFTSSALAFMFENLGKPVVITGSQLPISDVRTDAVMNFVNSIYIAGHKATGLPCIPEVIVVFADKILRGCRTRKVSSKSWAGFDSPNFPPLGTVGEHISIDETLLRKRPTAGQDFQVSKDMVDRVMDIAIFPGFKPSHLRQILVDLEGVDAVVLRTFGAGNAPGYPAFLDVIEKVISQHNKTIVNVTQCNEGMVEMGLYEASSTLLERGVISGLDMTPEAAMAKLMWTLGTKIGEQRVTQMQVSQRGEQSENLFDLRYGSCGNSSESKTSFANYCTPDRRFNVEHLSRATVRFSGLGFGNAAWGDSVGMRVFMNLPTADASTPADHPRCVADLSFVWNGELFNPTHVIEKRRARSAIGEGDVTLSVVADEGVEFWFDELYLALFAKA
jgi:L-asparaginase